MVQKKLQKGSILDEYDLDGDNEITNEELQQAKEIKENALAIVLIPMPHLSNFGFKLH